MLFEPFDVHFAYLCKTSFQVSIKNLAMSHIVPQFITDEKGKRVSVIIPIEFYMQLVESMEELEDIRLYDEVKARHEERIPLTDYIAKR